MLKRITGKYGTYVDVEEYEKIAAQKAKECVDEYLDDMRISINFSNGKKINTDLETAEFAQKLAEALYIDVTCWELILMLKKRFIINIKQLWKRTFNHK